MREANTTGAGSDSELRRTEDDAVRLYAATEDGRAATIAVSELPSDPAQMDRLIADLDTALCQ